MIEPMIFPGKISSLADIRKYVNDAAAEAGLDKRAAYHLCLAVDEIATNSIQHGYEERGLQGTLTIWSECQEEQLYIFLEDEGEKYDPTQRETPVDLDAPPEERRIGGLGVYLTKLGVDEFRYERVNERNRYIFVVSRSQPGS